MAKLSSITIDAANAEALANWWAQALEGYAVDPEWNMVIRSDSGPLIYFQQVPDPKTVKNRAHLNLSARDVKTEVERLISLGARIDQEMEEGGHRWTNMFDPEGNEFCVSPARDGT